MSQIKIKQVAVGTEESNAFQVPQWAGGIGKVAVRGAGAEKCTLKFSSSAPDQVIPAQDIAINTDPLEVTFVEVNQPLQPGTQITVLPEGTGTATASVFVQFVHSVSGEQYHWVYASIDTSSASVDDKILSVPDYVSILSHVFARGPDLESLGMKLGAGGPEVAIPGRNIALNTDAEPFPNAVVEVREPAPPGGEIDVGTIKSGTGGASSVFCAFI